MGPSNDTTKKQYSRRFPRYPGKCNMRRYGIIDVCKAVDFFRPDQPQLGMGAGNAPSYYATSFNLRVHILFYTRHYEAVISFVRLCVPQYSRLVTIVRDPALSIGQI